MDISNATNFRQILTHETVPLRFFVTKSLIATPSTFFRDDMNKQNTKNSRILPIAILLNLSYTKTFLATLRPHVSATKTYNHDILHLSHYNARYLYILSQIQSKWSIM